MTNPFDDEDGDFLVLINDERQHSLWPSFRDVPAGWQVVGPRGNRKVCLDWIDQNWTDMRPLSLIRQMEGTSGEDTAEDKR
jgi:MbtH protein